MLHGWRSEDAAFWRVTDIVRIDFRPVLYICIYARSTRTGLALLGSSSRTESIIVFRPTPPERPVFGPRLKFWRTTGLHHRYERRAA